MSRTSSRDGNKWFSGLRHTESLGHVIEGDQLCNSRITPNRVAEVPRIVHGDPEVRAKHRSGVVHRGGENPALVQSTEIVIP